MRSSKPRSGPRPDLGPTRFRSGWECNYARYLNSLIASGDVVSWEYEPKIFEFPVKRGNRMYKPDFLVHYPDGHHEWHEVKGWMDNDSRIKLKRFAIHFPDEPLVLVDSKAYRTLEKEHRDTLPHWE